MATLKDAVPPASAGLARGRDGYANYGALRTKPGRADSPPTLSMSCSDKLAAWTLLGMQGALLSSVLGPVYIDELVIGGVAPALRDAARADCMRALRDRLGDVAGLPPPFRHRVPDVHLTSVSFPLSKEHLAREHPGVVPISSSDSMSWIADCGPPEMIVGGIRKGASVKARAGSGALRESSRSRICKLSLFACYLQLRDALALPALPPSTTYYEAKHAYSADYQLAKRHLRTAPGLFADWLVSGRQWESFDVLGQVSLLSDG